MSRRVQVLFLVALLGVLLCIGLLLADLAGPVAATAYAAVAVALVGYGAVRARRAAAARQRPAHHCTCCDGDHSAPVRVV